MFDTLMSSIPSYYLKRAQELSRRAGGWTSMSTCSIASGVPWCSLLVVQRSSSTRSLVRTLVQSGVSDQPTLPSTHPSHSGGLTSLWEAVIQCIYSDFSSLISISQLGSYFLPARLPSPNHAAWTEVVGGTCPGPESADPGHGIVTLLHAPC